MLKFRPFQLDGMAAQLIIDHARRSMKREVCGLILYNGNVIQVENIAEMDHDFAMNPSQFRQYRDLTACVYHSHVGDDSGAELTLPDINSAKEVGIPILSYHPGLKLWDYFDPHASHPFPMEENGSLSPRMDEYYCLWRFVYGRSDCAALCRAWYAGKLNINIRDYPRLPIDDVIAQRTNQFPAERIIENDFELLPRDALVQDHDIVILDLSELNASGHHLAIVNSAENNTILHNVGEGRYSTIEMYSDYWRDRTRGVMRHKRVTQQLQFSQRLASVGQSATEAP